MTGLSTRFAYKILSTVFNFDQTEIAANPVHLMYVLEQRLAREQFPDEVRERYLEHIKGYLAPRYAEFIGKEIQTAYLESYSEYGQNIFDRYVTFADCWIQDEEYRDPDTGEIFDRAALNDELEKIEKPAGIANPKDFRNEIVNFVLRARANNDGRNPAWTSYEKLREVIEKKMFSNTEDLLPVISFNAKASEDEQEEAPELRRAHGREGLHGEAGAPARRVVPARAEVVADAPLARGIMSIIDRREPAPQERGQPQRFLRRYRAQIREAVARAVGAAARSPRPIATPASPFPHGPVRARSSVTGAAAPRDRPAGQQGVRDRRRDPAAGGRRRRRRRQRRAEDGEGEDEFVFPLSREEFLDFFFDDLELPDLIKTQLTAIAHSRRVRAGYRTDGTPSNLAVVRTMRESLARRIAFAGGAGRGCAR